MDRPGTRGSATDEHGHRSGCVETVFRRLSAFEDRRRATQEHERQHWAPGREDHRRLQALAARFSDSGVDATAMLVQGATAPKILEEVGRVNADWVIMGSHGHSAMYELLVGSVTEAVVRKAACPVLVVPSSR